MSWPFRYTTRVRFHDADPAGIAFFARVFTWCHDAYEELMREGGAPLEQLTRGDVGLPLKSASAEFHRPLPHGAALTIEVRLAEINPKGFTLEHTVLGEDGAPCARVTTVHVAFSKQAQRPVALPPAVAALFSPEAT